MVKSDLSTKVSQLRTQNAMFRKIQSSVLGLVECLNKIIREMTKNNDMAKNRHFAYSPTWLVTEDTHLTHFQANSVNSYYGTLCNEISKKKYCEPLYLTNLELPT